MSERQAVLEELRADLMKKQKGYEKNAKRTKGKAGEISRDYWEGSANGVQASIDSLDALAKTQKEKERG